MNILLAVDDDRPSLEAARATAQWFPDDARIVALHVGPARSAALESVAVPAVAWGDLVGYPYLTAATWREGSTDPDDGEAQRIAQRAASIAHGESRTERGEPAEVICQVARDIDADLIVVGTGDRGWLSRLLDPSVAADVVSEAPCSVLVVRPSGDRVESR